MDTRVSSHSNPQACDSETRRVGMLSSPWRAASHSGSLDRHKARCHLYKVCVSGRGYQEGALASFTQAVGHAVL